MKEERWQLLMNDDSVQLTPEELAQGYHFCAEWDGLLIGPGDDEMSACSCLPKGRPAYAYPLKLASVTRRPFRLFVGANGEPTYGLEVTSTDSADVCRKNGRQHIYPINETVFRNAPTLMLDRLGLSQADYAALRAEFDKLHETNKNTHGKQKALAGGDAGGLHQN